MSVVAKQVQIVTSVDGFLNLVTSIVADVKAGKTPEVVVSEAVPELVKALSGLGDLKSDVANRKAVETTVALRLVDIVDSLV